MIERQFLKRRIKEHQIEEYISNILDKAGYSHTEIHRTPMGEKVVIFTSKPGLIVGRGGSSIKELTETLKTKFGMENPQVEVSEIETPNLNATSVAKRIIHTFERFGPKRFKSVGYKVLQDIIDSGALGAEIVISGRGVPSSRAKSWRFKAGYIKKSGDISENYVKKGIAVAHLSSGAVGVKVSILTPDIKLPDKITKKEIDKKIVIEKIEEKIEPEKKKETKKKTTKITTKKSTKKKKEKTEPKTEPKKELKSEEEKNGNNKKE